MKDTVSKYVLSHFYCYMLTFSHQTPELVCALPEGYIVFTGPSGRVVWGVGLDRSDAGTMASNNT
jgi:hypothetical protein